jgi:hypothetical protein
MGKTKFLETEFELIFSSSSPFIFWLGKINHGQDEILLKI